MRFVLVASCLLGCVGCAKTGDPGYREPASKNWVVVDSKRTDVRALVADEARRAKARGLVPVLYLDASYTIASTRLVMLRDRREMSDALDGIFVIEVDPSLASDYAPLQVGYWHSFHGVDADGRATASALDPGTKDGPCADGDAATCAAWIRPFAQSVRSAR